MYTQKVSRGLSSCNKSIYSVLFSRWSTGQQYFWVRTPGRDKTSRVAAVRRRIMGIS